MNMRKWIAENTVLLCVLMIAIGVILILTAARQPQGLVRDLCQSFGVLFVSVFFISFLYEKFLAEKHFSEFRSVMSELLGRMDSVQSMCARFGIREMFLNRNEFEHKYPMAQVFSSVKPGGRLFVYGRTLFHFFNKTDAVKGALKGGAKLQVLFLGTTRSDHILEVISFFRKSELQSPLELVVELVDWMKQHRPAGTFELRTYTQPLPDSLVFIQRTDRNMMVWDMTFGRDLNDKVILVLEPAEGNMAQQVLRRYDQIWELSQEQLHVAQNGEVRANRLAELMRTLSAEPGAAPNGGPATPVSNSGVTEGPPSVS